MSKNFRSVSSKGNPTVSFAGVIANRRIAADLHALLTDGASLKTLVADLAWLAGIASSEAAAKVEPTPSEPTPKVAPPSKPTPKVEPTPAATLPGKGRADDTLAVRQERIALIAEGHKLIPQGGWSGWGILSAIETLRNKVEIARGTVRAKASAAHIKGLESIPVPPRAKAPIPAPLNPDGKPQTVAPSKPTPKVAPPVKPAAKTLVRDFVTQYEGGYEVYTAVFSDDSVTTELFLPGQPTSAKRVA